MNGYITAWHEEAKLIYLAGGKDHVGFQEM